MVTIKVAVPVQDFLSSAGVVLVSVAAQTATIGSTVTNLRVVVMTAIGVGVHEVGLQRDREAGRQGKGTIGHTLDYSTATTVEVTAQLIGNVAVVQIR